MREPFEEPLPDLTRVLIAVAATFFTVSATLGICTGRSAPAAAPQKLAIRRGNPSSRNL